MSEGPARDALTDLRFRFTSPSYRDLKELIVKAAEKLDLMSELELTTFMKINTASFGCVFSNDEAMEKRIQSCQDSKDKMFLYGIWALKQKIAELENGLTKVKS